MTSFVVISTDKQKRETYITTFCEDQGIDTFDRTFLTLENSIKQNTQSIGIEDIKHMQKKIFLKPIKSKQKAVIVSEAHLLTPEAQNALLKVLEEPPQHTFFLLSSETKETLLPTILSRCQLIQIEEEATQLSEKERTEYVEFIENLKKFSVGKHLKKAETLAKEKEKAIAWIGKLIIVLRDKMIEEPETSYAAFVRIFQNLHTTLKTTNVNPRFAIENTLLSLL